MEVGGGGGVEWSGSGVDFISKVQSPSALRHSSVGILYICM